MFGSLPTDAGSVRDWSWTEYEQYYTALLKRPLYDDTVAEFLGDWTRLSELLDEMFSRLHVSITVNTADAEAEKRYHTFLETIYPSSEEAEQKLKTKLLSSGLTPKGFELPLRKMRAEAEIFREENLPLLIQEHKLTNEYDKIVGAQTVEWEGREVTVVQLRPHYQNVDRTVRQKAWDIATERQLKDREAINTLWNDFLAVRRELASNAGFGDYRSFRWQQMLRFDYTPEDCYRFHEAIEKAVLPAAVRICPSCERYVFPSHLSAEPGHRVVLDALGLQPVLELDMRLGEGTGAALAMGIIDAACRMLAGMATFEEAGVADKTPADEKSPAEETGA